jgi:hypothetical protein
MRLLPTLLLLLATTVPAAAQWECPLGSPDILRLTDWRVSVPPDATDPAAVTLHLEYESGAEKPFVDVSTFVNVDMVDGTRIATLGVQAGLALAPGETAEETMTLTGTGLEKVLDIDGDQVKVTLCTNLVAYADGSGTIFD